MFEVVVPGVEGEFRAFGMPSASPMDWVPKASLSLAEAACTRSMVMGEPMGDPFARDDAVLLGFGGVARILPPGDALVVLADAATGEALLLLAIVCETLIL